MILSDPYGYANTFNASIPAQKYGTSVHYRILANDTSGFWVMSSTYSYSVSDPISPLITDISTNRSEENTMRVTASVVEP